MRLVDMTHGDVAYIFSEYWDPFGELQKTGFSVQTMKSTFSGMVGKPFTAAVINREGEPCALVALLPRGERKWLVCFAARKTAFLSIWISFTRFFKVFSDQMVKDGASLLIRCWSEDGKPHEWFETMGFFRGLSGSPHYYWKR